MILIFKLIRLCDLLSENLIIMLSSENYKDICLNCSVSLITVLFHKSLFCFMDHDSDSGITVLFHGSFLITVAVSHVTTHHGGTVQLYTTLK